MTNLITRYYYNLILIIVCTLLLCTRRRGCEGAPAAVTTVPFMKGPQTDETGASSKSRRVQKVQKIIGDIKFPEDGCPEVSLPTHKLSAIMCFPPPTSLFAAELVLELLYDARFGGIHYGGDGADVGSSSGAAYAGESALASSSSLKVAGSPRCSSTSSLSTLT